MRKLAATATAMLAMCVPGAGAAADAPTLSPPPGFVEEFKSPALDTHTWIPQVEGNAGVEADLRTGVGAPERSLELAIEAKAASDSYVNSQVVSRYGWGSRSTLELGVDGRALLGHGGSNGFGFWNGTFDPDAQELAWFMYQSGQSPLGSFGPQGFFVLAKSGDVSSLPGGDLKIVPLDPALLEGRHRFAIDKHPTWVDFYVDRRRVARVEGGFVPQRPQRVHLWVDNALFGLNLLTGRTTRTPQPIRARAVEAVEWVNAVSGSALPTKVSRPRSTMRGIVRRGTLTASCRLPLAGVCRVQARVNGRRAGAARAVLDRGGTARLKIRIAGAVRRRLAAARSARVTLRAAASDGYGREGHARRSHRLKCVKCPHRRPSR